MCCISPPTASLSANRRGKTAPKPAAWRPTASNRQILVAFTRAMPLRQRVSGTIGVSEHRCHRWLALRTLPGGRLDPVRVNLDVAFSHDYRAGPALEKRPIRRAPVPQL